MAAGDPVANTAVTRGPRSIVAASPGNETGERESLDNVINQIDPDDVPLWSNLDKKGGKAIFEEWLISELETPTDTPVKEGSTFNPSVSKQMDRIGNYMTIRDGQKVVSGTFDAVDTAGRAKETIRQQVLAGVLVKRKCNRALYLNNAYSGVDPRAAAGFPAYVGNAVGGTGFQPGGWNGGKAFTPGTARNLTTGAQILDVLQTAYENGGDPTQLYMTPSVKRQFSRLTDLTIGSMQAHFDMQRRSGAQLAFFGAVDRFQSDWGWHDVVVDRNRPGYGSNVTYILALDPDHAEVRTLPGRAMFPVPVARTGDATPVMILNEFTLAVTAPKAHGIVADLNSSSRKSEAGHGSSSTILFDMGGDTLALNDGSEDGDPLAMDTPAASEPVAAPVAATGKGGKGGKPAAPEPETF